MDDNELYTRLSDKIDKLIDKLDEKLSTVDSRLSNHEVRIVVLEQKAPEKQSLKSDLIGMLVKGLVAAIFIIGSLSGAGAMLKSIFGL